MYVYTYIIKSPILLQITSLVTNQKLNKEKKNKKCNKTLELLIS